MPIVYAPRGELNWKLDTDFWRSRRRRKIGNMQRKTGVKAAFTGIKVTDSDPYVNNLNLVLAHMGVAWHVWYKCAH